MNVVVPGTVITAKTHWGTLFAITALPGIASNLIDRVALSEFKHDDISAFLASN